MSQAELKKMVLISPELFERFGMVRGVDEKKNASVKKILRKRIPANRKWTEMRQLIQKYNKIDEERQQPLQLPVMEQKTTTKKRKKKSKVAAPLEAAQATPPRPTHTKLSRLRPRSKLRQPMRWEVLP